MSPLIIYPFVYQDSEGVNDCPYVPRRYRNSGIRHMITQLGSCLNDLGNRILIHAKKMKYTRERGYKHRSSYLNLSKNKNKHRIIIAAFSAIVC